MFFTEDNTILEKQQEASKEAGSLSSYRENRLNTENLDKQNYKQLFQNVIHDLKNPIGNIMGVVSLLELDSEKDKELLQIIKNSCTNALAILNKLLIDEKRQETSGLEKASVNNLLRSCIAHVTGSLALKSLSIQHKALRDDLFILIDKQAVKRAFLNIISNAMKFSPEGATIKIASEIRENILHISIEDQGIGIPQHLQPYIFEKFTPAQRTGTNGEMPTGLGLYFTRQSVLKHHGRIWFESVEQQGTVFHIEFGLDDIAVI